MQFLAAASYPALVEYLRDHLDWPFFEEDPEDNRFDYAPEELGIDPKWSVAIERISQLRPSEGDGPWGIFYLQFEKKRLPVVVLRRILRALVPKSRATAGSASRPAWNARDLLFICATGESGQRGITFAHFHEVEKHHIAQLRTFGWDETESHLTPLAGKLEKLRWENQEKWDSAFTLRHGQLVSDSKALAGELAIFARGIRQRTLDLYEVETEEGELHTLYKAFQSALIADMKPEGFADTVAQTIAYGLFAGRATGATLEKIGLAHLEAFVPKTNPFLRELFGKFTHLGFDVGKGVDFDDLGIVDLVEFLNGIPVKEITDNFGRQSGGGIEDPVIYFYENFLKEYDEKQRVQRGVYYTPKPVVDFIVRGVHQLLIDELDCPDGLADISKHKVGGKDEFKVMILDPATGTGTFLQSAIEVIYDHLQKKWRGEGIKSEAAIKAKWNEYVPTGLLPRLHGFELMMASYTVAHMKLGLKLQELGYEFGSDERLRVYLTNTLEPPHESEQKALDFPDFLAHEAQAADEVKGKTPISVVFGNPPYSSSVTENSWIMGLIADFKKDLGEQKADLSREEWKFMRLAGYYAQRTPNLITGWVINNAFLKAITHRLLRQHLYETASKIRVVNLHGSSKPPEFVPAEIQSGLGISKKDVNVFDIQQGVTIFLSLARKEEIIPEVTYFDLWGTRERKYEQLSKDLLKSPSVKPLDPTLPQFFFIPRDNSNEEEYAQGVSIEAIFTSNVSGIQSGRDHFVSTMNEAELSNRIKAIADGQSWASIAPDVAPPIWSGFSLSSFRHALKANERCRASWLSCPFDVRPILFHSSVIKRTRGDIMANMLRPNIGLSSVRQLSTPSWRHVFAVNGIISDTGISQNSREYNYLFPLYLYPSKTQTAMDLDAQLLGFGPDKRRANLSPDFVAQMGTKLSLKWQSDGRGDLKTHFGPEDVLAYIYAVFHAPSYRARYAEFLKTDFPRVPLTSDVSLFRSLVEFGHELLAIHTLSEEVTAKAPTAGPTPSGEVAAGYPKFCSGRVSINTKSSFDDVPEAVWNFHIGGYQVAHKWLKDRKGRELTPDDAKHYRRVLWALGETITRMEAIDELIEGAGGFPLVGSGEKVEVDVNRFFD